MASIKALKKEIDNVVADYFDYTVIMGRDNKQVDEILAKLTVLWNETRSKVKPTEKFENRKQQKEYYNSLFKELLVKTNETLADLNTDIK